MRDSVLDYIQSNNLGSYKLSRSVPRDESGTPLYLKNPKTIFVDNANKSINQLFTTFRGPNISTELTSITVVFTNDTKTIPNNYNELVGILVAAKNVEPNGGFTGRDVAVNTEIVEDLQVTTVELTFTKLT